MSKLSKALKKAQKWVDARTGGHVIPSVGSLAGTITHNPVMAVAGSKASGKNPVDDLAIGARNAALITGAQGLAGAGGGMGAGGAAEGAATAASRGGVTGFLGRNWDKIIPVGLGVWNAYEGHKADQRAQGLEEEALRQAEARWNEMAPLRTRALAGLESAQRPDLSALTYDVGNPYSRTRRIPRVGGGA